MRAQGLCDHRFWPVQDVLEEAAVRLGGRGAAVAISSGSRVLVDLRIGYADGNTQRPWGPDTHVNLYSVGKGVVALALNMLWERGQIDLQAFVCDYWPEFACHEKSAVTIDQVLSHTAGLPAIRRPVQPEWIFDFGRMAELLAEEELWWEPGTRIGYHAATFGWLTGELVRRVTQESVGTFIAREIAGPLGAAFLIGVPGTAGNIDFATLHEEAPSTMPPCPSPDMESAYMEWKTAWNPPRSIEIANTEAWRRAEIPSSNAHATARGISLIYSNLCAHGSGSPLLAEDSILRMRREQASGENAIGGGPLRFGRGVALPTPGQPLPPKSFGHPGRGGSFGVAIPEYGLGIGYATSSVGPEGEGLAQRLLEALAGVMAS